MTHSRPTIPEAASSRSSVKDTLFLSKAESEWMEEGGGGVVALGPGLWPQPTEPEPGRDRVSVERVGELGQRKIPGLHLNGWGSTIQQRNTWRLHRERQIYWEWAGRAMRRVGRSNRKKLKKKTQGGVEGCDGEKCTLLLVLMRYAK